MTAPNMVNITSMVGKSLCAVVPVSLGTLLANAASSNKVLKVNTLIITNVDGTSGSDVSVQHNDTNGQSNYLAYQITVPAKTNLVLISKDTSLYLEEGADLKIMSSTSLDLAAHVSYEEIE